MNRTKWIFYGCLICIVASLLVAFLYEAEDSSYYAGVLTGLALVALIVTLGQPGALKKLR